MPLLAYPSPLYRSSIVSKPPTLQSLFLAAKGEHLTRASSAASSQLLKGPIVEGVVSIFAKYKDTELGKYKVDGEVRTVEVQASTQTLIAFKDDIGVRLCRDMITFPVAVWCLLGTWDTIIAHRFPEWRFIVEKFPAGPLEYLPIAVLTFLFGNIALNTWKRR